MIDEMTGKEYEPSQEFWVMGYYPERRMEYGICICDSEIEARQRIAWEFRRNNPSVIYRIVKVDF